MIYVAMPVGSSHGWGICGKYITRELAALLPGQVRLIPPGNAAVTAESVGDELEYSAIGPLVLKPEEIAAHLQGSRLQGPLLSCIVDKQLLPALPLRGTRTVGYTFFEENLLTPAWIDNGRRNFDQVTTGSSWCTNVLKENGLANVETVIQGIDPRVFYPESSTAGLGEPSGREFLRDAFVIFSGGKFELRKGQDVVIRATAILQQRHKDVWLVNAWFNPWPQSFDTMKVSPHLKWPNISGGYVDVMNKLLAHNGLDVARVITLLPRPNALMARIYRNTDVGVFPNRSEGGTNLVLMEYMACGKPVVATAGTGHADVVKESHALVIAAPTELTLNGPQGPVAKWPEPSLDETIEKLEWAYQNQDALRQMGEAGGRAMAPLTWEKTARDFLALLQG